MLAALVARTAKVADRPDPAEIRAALEAREARTAARPHRAAASIHAAMAIPGEARLKVVALLNDLEMVVWIVHRLAKTLRPGSPAEPWRAAGRSSYKRAMPRRIVLDTDIGTDVDDALALALALASPELELVAVTTVSGDTPLRARIAARLLALAGRAAVPVHAGCEMPLAGRRRLRAGRSRGGGDPRWRSRTTFSSEPAVEALLRLFRAGDGLELVAIGPLTNIAVALERDPTLARRVARLTLMGGWMRGVTIGGRSLPPSIDYNLCSDAVASRARAVVGHPDPARHARRHRAGLAHRGRRRETRARSVDRCSARSGARCASGSRASGISSPASARRSRADTAAFLHDPLTLACAYDESFCRIEELAIEPVTVDGVFRTLERTPGAAGTFPMRCATAVDAARFTAQVRRRLGLAS